VRTGYWEKGRVRGKKGKRKNIRMYGKHGDPEIGASLEVG